MKTIKQINEKIRKGEAVVVRADEMPEIYEENPRKAAKEVDVVTTGTFGVMCSSGAFLNFGHSDPPIKMQKVWLNEVEAYTGIAAVDAYIGATELSMDKGLEYGGGHVIEDLVSRKEVDLRATSYGSDCYPRKKIETTLTIDDLSQAVMVNPRNCYQRYKAAINSTNTILHTYMGTLLPDKRNVNFAGTGEISPLANDPNLEVVGVGTRIFLCGAQGIILGEGTQSSPPTGYATIRTQGNLKEMSKEFLAGASILGYGASLFIGIGIPIPILDERIARNTAVRNEDIRVDVLDFGVPKRDRPVVGQVSYAELFSGRIEIDGKKVKTSPLSSLKKSLEIMDTLKGWIQGKEFFLSETIQPLPKDSISKPMKQRKMVPFVGEIMTKRVITAHPEDSIDSVAETLVRKEIDQIPIVDAERKLVGIVTSWDITKAVALKKKKLGDIMTRNVINSRQDEYIDAVSRRFEKYKIHSTPVVNDKKELVGIITMADILHSGVTNKLRSKTKK
ncbi:MAG: homocysteine biosynthesis protein [Candidatus Altiarchaeota archaeon]|nr:homocysteine biosynthesis protein [Candidatus Altiarchaeota archaeon]